MRASTDSSSAGPGNALLERVRLLLDLPAVQGAPAPHTSVPLPSRLATAELAWASVASAVLAAGRSPIAIDPHRVAAAYRSDRLLSIDGVAPDVWSPYSGFWRTADGWIRTHGNYPHHSAALRAGLELRDDADAEAVRAGLAAEASADAIASITRAGGLAVAVTVEDPSIDRTLRDDPLLDVRRIDTHARSAQPTRGTSGGDHDDPPLAGIRVLDLTRVIAGPVCTRTLALLGADVLRIDPPHLPEPEWQHLDTGHGKRSALLNARSARMHELLAAADAVVLGYRPAALERMGLQPLALAERYPGLLVAQLSAWGTDHPELAGFDSLVQAASGIALIESPDGDRPGALPAQALDHSAGYLLAAAVTALIRRRSHEDGSWYIGTSLRRVAAELLGMPRLQVPHGEVDFDVRPHLARFEIGARTLVTSRPALPGLEFGTPHGWGSDQPIW
jgi:hypothetical protein